MKCRLKTVIFILLSIVVLTGISASGNVKNDDLAVSIYPVAIYDSAKCSIYKNHISKIMFMFFYKSKSKITDLKSSSKLYVELPEKLILKYAGIMDGWKKNGGEFDKFTSEKVTRDGEKYIRYMVPLPVRVDRPSLKKALPGGMFGGTTNNMTNIFVKPEGKVPGKFKIYWEINGKYQVSGSFPAYLAMLPPNLKNPRRIKLRSFGPLVNMGNPPEYIKDLGGIYRKIGIEWINTQHADGPNKGYRDIWTDGGFKFYGGGGFLHTLMQYSLAQRTASSNMNDYMVGLDGKRSYGTASEAYHGRIWCPKAVVSKGRYPYELNIAVVKRETAQGATELDADFEVHGWSHCFCPDCLRDFAELSKIEYDLLKAMTPVAIVKTYPMQWYKFRSMQTGQLYTVLRDYLRKNNPGVKMGCNTILLHPQNDLGDLKYGICDFAEDPRLLKDSVDYFLADTLTGSVYDAISVDVIRKTTNKPVISVAGCSYCVGFSPFDMPFRRMTADMTGDKYGYERRTDFLKLGIVHQAASGAAGVRFSVEEADAAIKAGEASAILAKVEDWYLDGKRADEKVEVIDLTQSPSHWLKDESRVGGRIWRSFYNSYCGLVQFRVHLKDGGILISLFNWDPYQNKKWLVRLTADLVKDYYLTDVINNKTICLDGAKQWMANELSRGVPIAVPSAGMTILKLTPKNTKTDESESISRKSRNNMLELAENKKPYNQYGWYKGGQIDMNEYVEKALKRPLFQLKKYGGRQKIKSLEGNVEIPFTSDFSKLQRGLSVWGSKKDKFLYSDKKYCFAGIDFKPDGKTLELEIEFKCIDGARFGMISYEKTKALKKTAMLCWGENAEDFRTLQARLSVDKYKAKVYRILLYNMAKKGSVIIKRIKIMEQTNADKK